MRALVFDFDGLILDTETPEVAEWRRLFRAHGTEFPDSWWMQNTGRGADQIEEWPFDLLERQIGRTVDRAALDDERKRNYWSVIETADARPGIRATLEWADMEGVAVAVASSSRHEWVDRHLERLGLLDRFAAICCADDVARAKPHPDLYELACERLGLATEEALALEDSANGIAAAKAAGMRVLAYPNPITAHLDLSQADGCLEELAPDRIRAFAATFWPRWKSGQG